MIQTIFFIVFFYSTIIPSAKKTDANLKKINTFVDLSKRQNKPIQEKIPFNSSTQKPNTMQEFVLQRTQKENPYLDEELLKNSSFTPQEKEDFIREWNEERYLSRQWLQ